MGLRRARKGFERHNGMNKFHEGFSVGVSVNTETWHESEPNYLEGGGDLVSSLKTRISHIVTLVIPQ